MCTNNNISIVNDIINVTVQSDVINITIGEIAVTKSEITLVAVPSITYGESKNITVPIIGAAVATPSVVAKSGIIPVGIQISTIINNGSVDVRVFNDGSGDDTINAFNFNIQLIKF